MPNAISFHNHFLTEHQQKQQVHIHSLSHANISLSQLIFDQIILLQVTVDMACSADQLPDPVIKYKAGDMILTADPLVHVLQHHHRKQYCDNCYKEV